MNVSGDRSKSFQDTFIHVVEQLFSLWRSGKG